MNELGFGVPDHLHLVPVDFEADGSWWEALRHAGFDAQAKTLVSSSGVSMYITKQATTATLRQLATLASGSILAMTFMLPIELADKAERPGLQGAARGAEASGTPWISYYTPDEIVTLAFDAGLVDAHHLTTAEVAMRYLAGRTADLRASTGEGILLART